MIPQWGVEFLGGGFFRGEVGMLGEVGMTDGGG
jgi:hypothetical protein